MLFAAQFVEGIPFMYELRELDLLLLFLLHCQCLFVIYNSISEFFFLLLIVSYHFDGTAEVWISDFFGVIHLFDDGPVRNEL